jgi:alpha-glucoside transport system substrate-binding protein
MHRTRRWTVLAGTALATLALTFSSIGVAAQDESPAADGAAAATGYAELDQAMGADQPFAGTRVSIQTQWIGGEGENFAEAIAPFEAATGIDVVVDSIGSSHETVLRTRIEGGAPPDTAMLAQPAAILDYGAGGQLVDIATIMDAQKLSDEHASTISLYQAGESIWAVPYKVDVKGVIWYPIAAFEAAGYQVPTTWDELLALSDQIVADGGTPWCSGMEAGTATGWQATDWVEEILLRTAGPELYDQWVAGEVPFSSPEVKAAFDELGKIYFTEGYTFGGNTAIVATRQTESLDPMFTDDLANPGCWMYNIPFWYGPEFFPDQRASGEPSQFVVGEDVGIFPLPPVDPANVPALGAGDGLMVLVDRPEVRAFAQYLATPQGIETWVKKGAAISANTATPAEWYEGNYESEVASGVLNAATSFSFDASDLMPAEVGAGTFWTGLVDWITANGANTDEVLQRIDESWPQS